MRISLLKNGLVLLCLICSSMAIGQNKKTDSLLALLKLATEDTMRIRLYQALGKEFGFASKFPEAKNYGEQALALSQKIHFKKGVDNSYLTLGNIYNLEGLMFQRSSNYAEALKSHFTSLKFREKIANKQLMAWSYGNIGLVHWQRFNFSEGLKYFLIALKLFEEAGDKNGVAGSYNNIGLIHVNQKNYAEAMKYYQSAMSIYEELGQKEYMINLYFNMGFLNEERGQFEDAVKYHKAALKICEDVNNTDGVAASYTNIGGAVLLLAKTLTNEAAKQQMLKTSLDYQNKSLKLYQDLNENWSYTNVNVQLAKVYLEMKDYAAAKKCLEEAVKYSNEASIYDSKETYELLTRLDSIRGDWGGAFDHYKQLVILKDSIFNDESSKKIMQAQLQYGFDKKEDSLKYQQQLTDEQLQRQILLSGQQQQSLLLKEQQLALLNTEKRLQQLQLEKTEAENAVQKSEATKNQNQLVLLNKEKELQTFQLRKEKQLKNYLFAAIAGLLILSFFIYRHYRVRQQLKLQKLRNKIASDLHDDVGSTLSSISIFSQMAQAQSKETIPMLETIGESSQKMLDAMADIVWTINPDNDQFEKIISRMKSFAFELLGARNIDFEFIADDEVTRINVPMDVRKNLYLIFKEATNNLVKYAQANKAMFTIKGEKNSLMMMIRDNGKGFDINQSTQGNGLKNMKRRASEIGAQLWIQSLPGNGTTIQLSVAV